MRGLNPAAKNNRFDLHPKLLPLEGRVPRHPPHRAPASCRSSYTAVTTQRRLRTREALGVRQRSGAVKALRALRHSFWQSGKLHPTHGHTDLARLPRATWAGRRGSHSSGWENQRLWVETCRRQLSEVGRVPVRPGGVGAAVFRPATCPSTPQLVGRPCFNPPATWEAFRPRFNRDVGDPCPDRWHLTATAQCERLVNIGIPVIRNQAGRA